jgi:hypothetical protein
MAKVWAIAKKITNVLNFVINAYVMSQSMGHWLLFNASTKFIALTVNMETKFEHVSNMTKVLDEFDIELIYL